MKKQVEFAEAFRFWLKLGFISFGGPVGQIAIMQKELVEKREWIEQDDFLHALNFVCCFPDRRRSSLQPISAGGFTEFAAELSRARFL